MMQLNFTTATEQFHSANAKNGFKTLQIRHADSAKHNLIDNGKCHKNVKLAGKKLKRCA